MTKHRLSYTLARYLLQNQTNFYRKIVINTTLFLIKSGKCYENITVEKNLYILDAARSAGILKAKQNLGVTFNSDKLGSIDFTKFSKLSMCSAGAGWYNGLGFLLGTAHGQFLNFCKSNAAQLIRIKSST